MRIIIIAIMPFHDYTKSYSGQSNSLIVMATPDGWRSHLSWPSWEWFLPMVGVVR